MADADEEYARWVQQGIDRGWISPPDCIHHGAKDPIPWTEEESELVEGGDDPCLVAARFWGTESAPMYLGDRH